MAGMLGRGRGLTVDTLEDSSELPVPGLQPQGPPKIVSPVPGSKIKSSSHDRNLPLQGYSAQLSGTLSKADTNVKLEDVLKDRGVKKSHDSPGKDEEKPDREISSLQLTQARHPQNEGSITGKGSQSMKQQDHIKKEGKAMHKGKGDGYHVKSGHHGRKGNHVNYKSRHTSNENQNASQGSVNVAQSRKPYVPVLQQYNQQQQQQQFVSQQQNEMQHLQMKEQQLKQQQLQLQQLQQENLETMDVQQQEELLKRQKHLQLLQDNQIKLVQMQQKQLQLEQFQPHTEQQVKQKQQQLMQLQEEQIRLQQVQMQYLEQQQQREHRKKVEDQLQANKQVSEFYQSQAMSTEQILQQYGSQGVICGRGKRLEELTKRTQDQGRPRPPGPQQQPRPSAQTTPPYGLRMPQPSYMVKEEMGRNRLSSMEDQVGISVYEHELDGKVYEGRKSTHEKQDDGVLAKNYQGYTQHKPPGRVYRDSQSPKHPQGQPIPSPTLRTSPQMHQQNKSLEISCTFPDTNIPSSSADMVQDAGNIDLPPGIPTHLPPPPLPGVMVMPSGAAPNMGPLDHMSLGGGYATSDIAQYKSTSPPKQQRGQYKYPAVKGQGSAEGQGMYYNKKGPLKSVHQLGQQQQPQHKGQQGQKGQTGATKSTKKPQMTTGSTPPKASLSTEEQKNEYEWQKFKIIRKVKKALEEVKEEAEEEIAKMLIKIMQEESQRLANYPWPKEQYVAVAEIVQKSIDSCKAETHKLLAKLLLVLHKLHPEKNLCADLKKAIVDKYPLYVKVSPATNAEKLLDSCVSFLLELYLTANQAEDQTEFKDVLTKFVLSVTTKWIAYDAEDTELAEVYSYCLIAFFKVLGPQFDEDMNNKFYITIRESQIKGKNRAMREGLLDLLLFQGTGWKTVPTRPEKYPDLSGETNRISEEEHNDNKKVNSEEIKKVNSEESGADKDTESLQKDVPKGDGKMTKTSDETREMSSGADLVQTDAKESSVERQTEGKENNCQGVSLGEKVESGVHLSNTTTANGQNTENKPKMNDKPVSVANANNYGATFAAVPTNVGLHSYGKLSGVAVTTESVMAVNTQDTLNQPQQSFSNGTTSQPNLLETSVSRSAYVGMSQPHPQMTAMQEGFQQFQAQGPKVNATALDRINSTQMHGQNAVRSVTHSSQNNQFPYIRFPESYGQVSQAQMDRILSPQIQMSQCQAQSHRFPPPYQGASENQLQQTPFQQTFPNPTNTQPQIPSMSPPSILTQTQVSLAQSTVNTFPPAQSSSQVQVHVQAPKIPTTFARFPTVQSQGSTEQSMFVAGPQPELSATQSQRSNEPPAAIPGAQPAMPVRQSQLSSGPPVVIPGSQSALPVSQSQLSQLSSGLPGGSALPVTQSQLSQLSSGPPGGSALPVTQSQLSQLSSGPPLVIPGGQSALPVTQSQLASRPQVVIPGSQSALPVSQSQLSQLSSGPPGGSALPVTQSQLSQLSSGPPLVIPGGQSALPVTQSQLASRPQVVIPGAQSALPGTQSHVPNTFPALIRGTRPELSVTHSQVSNASPTFVAGTQPPLFVTPSKFPNPSPAVVRGVQSDLPVTQSQVPNVPLSPPFIGGAQSQLPATPKQVLDASPAFGGGQVPKIQSSVQPTRSEEQQHGTPSKSQLPQSAFVVVSENQPFIDTKSSSPSFQMNPYASAFEPQLFFASVGQTHVMSGPVFKQNSPYSVQQFASDSDKPGIELNDSASPKNVLSDSSLHSSENGSEDLSPALQGQVNQITDLCQPGSIFGSAATTPGVTSSRFPAVNSKGAVLEEAHIETVSSAKVKVDDDEMPDLEEHLSVSSAEPGESFEDKRSRSTTPQEKEKELVQRDSHSEDKLSTLKINTCTAEAEKQVQNPSPTDEYESDADGRLSPNKERELEIKALIEMGLSKDDPKDHSWNSNSAIIPHKHVAGSDPDKSAKSYKSDGARNSTGSNKERLWETELKSFNTTDSSPAPLNNKYFAEQHWDSNQEPSQPGFPALKSAQKFNQTESKSITTTSQGDTLMSPQQFQGGRISRAKGAISNKSPQKATDKCASSNSNNNGSTQPSEDLITPQQFQKGFSPIEAGGWNSPQSGNLPRSQQAVHHPKSISPQNTRIKGKRAQRSVANQSSHSENQVHGLQQALNKACRNTSPRHPDGSHFWGD